MDIESHIARLNQTPPTTEAGSDMLLAPHKHLPDFLRALLVADGTVTLLLGAFFDEDIEVATSEQSPFVLPADLVHLNMTSGDDAFYRCVSLNGSDSSTHYAKATSILNPMSLHPDLFTNLINENVGMGEVLRNSARGSYREVLSVTRESETEVSRTYVVFLNSQPAILITETFSIPVFQDSSSRSLR